MSLWSRISNALRGERLNREIEEELQSHIEEAIASGRDPDEARRTFGSILRQREASHSIRVAGWLESLLADVRFGWRQLCRNKVTSAAAVLSLALGIGSCVAAFRLIDALLWRPLPISDSSKLYVLSRKLTGLRASLSRTATGPRRTSSSCAMPSRTRPTSSPSATPTARTSPGPPTTTWRRPTSFMSPATCSRSSALSLRSAACSSPPMTAAPVLGPYAVLSWDYWNHRFGRDPHVLGRSLHIGDQTFEIIGVGPRDFTGTEKGTVTDIFLPLSMNSLATQDERHLAPHLPDVETRRQPGHRPRAAPAAPLRRQPRLRSRVLHVLPRHDQGGHRPLSQSRSLSSIPPALASPSSRRTIADYSASSVSWSLSSCSSPASTSPT